jgi:thymidylate synthase (FAD)
MISHTPDAEKLIAAAAKLCYSDTSAMNLMDNLDDEKAAGFVDMLASIGHESPIEHITFTFGIEGVSRTLLAQITRHRLASFSVQSQRYVKKSNFVFVTPPEIKNDEKALEIFNKSMNDAISGYNKLCDILETKYRNEMIAAGMSEKAAVSKAEKKAIEDARFVLPNACETKMMVTMNARSLMNFFKLRCCNRAQWEIRELATEMYRLCFRTAPSVFRNAGPSCCIGRKVCTEGKMSCGKADEVRETFRRIRDET